MNISKILEATWEMALGFSLITRGLIKLFQFISFYVIKPMLPKEGRQPFGFTVHPHIAKDGRKSQVVKRG